jgi:hypothetical protein
MPSSVASWWEGTGSQQLGCRGVVRGGPVLRRHGRPEDVRSRVKDDPLLTSKVAGLTVGGQVLGPFGGTDHFRLVAEAVGPITVGGVQIPTVAGSGNDDTLLGITGNFG